MKFLIFGLVVLVILNSVSSTTVFSNTIASSVNALPDNGLSLFSNMLKRRCPLCDSSVYSYCSEKLFHDSCCCHNPNNPYDRLPYQCQFADCSFLHANTCQEHKLITACCCTSHYIFKRK